MLKEKNQKYGVALTLIIMICLSSCTQIDYKYNCPVYPIGGNAVASELERIEYEKLRATWEWIGRINKLREELELCQNQSL